MKRISYLLLLSLMTSLVITSCSNQKTYAQLLDDEKALINSYIKRNNIQVVSTFPANTPWVSNGKEVYVLTTSGLYFHLITAGDTITDGSIALKDVVVPRYKQYTLDVVPDTTSNWNTIDFPYPNKFVYGDYTQSCMGFQEAVSYMKGNESEAKIIVPSKIGFSTYLNSVTPMGYDLKIKIQKSY